MAIRTQNGFTHKGLVVDSRETSYDCGYYVTAYATVYNEQKQVFEEISCGKTSAISK